MCGRTCLTLEPNQILCACKYISDKGNDKSTEGTNDKEVKDEKFNEYTEKVTCLTPEWRAEYNCGRQYAPSYNIAPTDITPVLVSADHFRDKDNNTNSLPSRVLMPMMWGMIPFWHKGDYRKHGLSTNNCRLEHLMNSKMYHGPFIRGQRCVVLCEGFYEWQTTKSSKPSERAAYLVHMMQNDEVKIYDKNTWDPSNINLLKMAGLFDIWRDENGDSMYSYSVITFESSKIMSWMHYRMPAILETEQQINDWLDYKHVSDKQALAALRPASNLKWHQVSNIVNNSRNKTDQCNKPIEMIQKKSDSNQSILRFFNVRKRREREIDEELNSDEDECSNKRQNIDNENNPPKRPSFRDFKESVKKE